MKLSRRRFLQLGAAASGVAAMEAQFGALQALGHELTGAGKDVDGGKEHATGEQRKSVATTCLQCGVTDGVLAYYEGDGKRRRIVKLEGNPKNPNTGMLSSANGVHGVKLDARLCAKGQAGLQQVYDPFRIRYPMMRDPEKRGDPKAWKRISWEQAVDEFAKRMNDIRKSKEPGRYVFHQGRNRFAPFTKRFNAAFGTKHTFSHTSICEASLKVGYETSFGQDLDASDVRNARYHISWGENIYEAAYMHNPLAQRVAAARVGDTPHGTKIKLVAVDPRMTQTAGAADEWLAPRPGTDAAIMLAMCHVIMRENLHDKEFLDTWTNYPSGKLKAHLAKYTPEFAEETSGAPAAQIERIAIEFAKNQPGFARAYNGISNHHNGTYNARCLALLNAVVGNIDKEGGFCLMKFTGFGKVNPEPDAGKVIEADKLNGEFPLLEAREEKYPLAHHGADHLLPHFMEETGYKIGLYLLHQFNPVYSAPDRKLWLDTFKDPEKVEFIVDFSPFVSETVQEVVDLVIPDCTYLERLQINDMPPVENFPFVHLMQPVIDPLYETRSMYDTMLAVAKKVDGMQEFFAFDTIEDYCKTSTEAVWGPGSWDRLKADGVLLNISRNLKDPAIKPSNKDYKTYADLTPDELNAARLFDTFRDRINEAGLDKLRSEEADIPDEDGPILDKDGKIAGVMRNGTAYKGFGTPSGLFEIFSKTLRDAGFNPLPIYDPVPSLKDLDEDELVLITGKFNVHTQSRTANCAWLMEIMHYNPMWIHPSDARKLDLETGDEVVMSSGFGTKEMKTKVYVTEGIRPGVVFQSISLGHWEYGPMASRGKDPFAALPNLDFKQSENIEKEVPAEWFKDQNKQADSMPDIWWSEQDWPGDARGETPLGKQTVGWSPNWVMPADDDRTDPIGGEYAWSGTPVKLSKSKASDDQAALGIAGLAAAAGVAALVKGTKNGDQDADAAGISEQEKLLETSTPTGGEV